MGTSETLVWCTAAQLRERYAVSEQRLLAYACRGNLSMRRLGSQLLFEERGVARLFPRLSVLRAAAQAADTPARALAVLGQAKLGMPS